MGEGVQAVTSIFIAIEAGIPLTHQPMNPLLQEPLGCCWDHCAESESVVKVPGCKGVYPMPSSMWNLTYLVSVYCMGIGM